MKEYISIKKIRSSKYYIIRNRLLDESFLISKDDISFLVDELNSLIRKDKDG